MLCSLHLYEAVFEAVPGCVRCVVLGFNLLTGEAASQSLKEMLINLKK
jgi:hypothetical protein